MFGSRNKIHIINLEKTVAVRRSCQVLNKPGRSEGHHPFRRHKRTSRDAIVAEAKRAGMPYVDQRWLGGMLTNFKTVKVS
ncbi:MAG: 30S ribosomal protein S2 [Parasutterella excrementihominis]